MSETLSITAPNRPELQNRERPREDEAGGFSFALASASLEQRASASLEAHGAAPSNAAGALTAARGRAGATSNAEPSFGRAEPTSQPSNAGRPQSAPQAATSTTPTTSTDATSRGSLFGGAPSATLQQSAGASIFSAPTAPHAPANTSPRNTAVARPAELTQPIRNAARAAATKAPLPAKPVQEFALLVAKRLENATAFDLRLDPPELGRVEGRVSFQDDGKTVLSLKFENAAAFDHFARDEAALRTALRDAGVDLSDAEFSFSQSAQDDAAKDAPLTSAPVQPIDSEFTSWAPQSRGVIDIRI